MYLISNSQVDVMPVRKNTEGSEPEDVLLAVLMNWVPTGLEHNEIMDDPVMKWASLTLPVSQAVAGNTLPADLGSELGLRLKPTSCHLEEKGSVIKCGFTLIRNL